MKAIARGRLALAGGLVALFLGISTGLASAGTPDVRRLPSSFAQCSKFFAGQRPPAVAPRPRLRELCYDGFAVLHSGDTRTPVFVAQSLNRNNVGGIRRQKSDRFYTDARLPRSERAELEDYKRSGYSRGHMAPSGDMSTEEAMAQSYSLANMVPQAIRHNSGAWARIEEDTRRYVQRAQGEVFVITGAVFAPDTPRIGDNGVGVPSHLFKLVYDSHTRRAWAHWQANDDDERASAPISYRELVRRTGTEWLPAQDVKT